jgi:cell division protease FtsH
MSQALGLVSHREERHPQFLGMPAADRNYSEDTARQIDVEVRQIIAGCYERAKNLLQEHRQVLEQVVEVLWEKETMEGEELRRLLKGEAPAEALAQEPAPPLAAAKAGEISTPVEDQLSPEPR